MRLHGFCTSCRRIKLVNLSGSALQRVAAGGIPSGECQACTTKKNCRHTRTNDRTGKALTLRCSDCTAWGRRDRGGRIHWS